MDLKIGVLGGGQLGRMLIQSAINWNVEVHILDPDPQAPCKYLTGFFSIGKLTDYQTVYQFGKKLDLITIEIENVNVEALKKLESEGKKIFPQPHIIELIQDKGAQKLFYQTHQIPTSPFQMLDNRADLLEKIKNNSLSKIYFQKLRRGGYDGRGVLKIDEKTDFDQAFDEPSFIEEGVEVAKEISVIVARNAAGEIQTFPVVEMVFNPQYNLVDYLFAPAEVSDNQANTAQELAQSIIQKLDMVGILAVEMFITPQGEVLVNEIAPRPHNSGHHTIEANITSQYEQHLRAILNFPLGNTDTRAVAAMLNLIGEPGFTGEARYEGIEQVLAQAGVYVHLYGKKITKPGRKMGHITILADSVAELKPKIAQIQAMIKVIAQ
ncbi:MAG: 5-(carboxyamino)imidazole ribonucleotide synthase [Microscillaceae bacterium]|jgi:5-(carboxyamino)imidazole ribonucleotide synthase|nr:5-(carboxyamino)imidazole ribonucleotide synthase [Microscillaceae bacterium]